MAEQEHPIARKDMGKIHHEVQSLLLHLVNTEGIKWRAIDSGHILLYPPDGATRPFKVSASRPAEAQIQHLQRQFMAPQGIKDEDGNVPGMEVEVAATTVPDGSGTWVPDGAQQAVRDLAAAMGVTIGGSVSEEDYLAVIAEKDYCQSQMRQLVERVEGLVADVEARDDALAGLTEQRDGLLLDKEYARTAVEEALDRLRD